ncbi:Methylsterol monooxygenase 1-1 [Escovopsis weberi]|uniref:Methylsterol monooxygenase 1-1 n=1 Tax=Escovopsis weberi TaxID=150374 RepID=A0A0M8N077_ESCWE|nr:Methylsterol monooxygenase 1-1 [Escovopsis weberi]
MDFLLSIPVLSYFLSPSAAPWSTSLNLIFFYMTWSTLILSHSPLAVHLFGILGIRLVFYLIPSLLTLLFDVSVPTLAEGLKHGGRSALPPRNARALSRLLALVLLNLALTTAVESGLSFAYLAALGHTEFKTTTTLPLPWQIFKHAVILMTARGILHYYVHRFLLHGPHLRSVARRHRAFSHCRGGAPFSMQLMADHPLPLLLDHLLPIYLPCLVLRPHLLVYFLFVAICTVEETIAMSGYNTIPGIILGGIARRTAIHYAGGGSTNFGRLGILDWVNGTSGASPSFNADEKSNAGYFGEQQEEEEHEASLSSEMRSYSQRTLMTAQDARSQFPDAER